MDPSASRIPSARNTRSKLNSKKISKNIQDASSPTQISNTQDPSVVRNDPPASPNHDFNIHETSELINMIEHVGLNGRGLDKDTLVAMCDEYHDLSKFFSWVNTRVPSLQYDILCAVVIPRRLFRFTLPKPRSQSPPRLESLQPAEPPVQLSTSRSTSPEEVLNHPETQLIHPKQNKRKGKKKDTSPSDLPPPNTSTSVQDRNSLKCKRYVLRNPELQRHGYKLTPELQLKAAIRRARKGKSREISPPHVSFEVLQPKKQTSSFFHLCIVHPWEILN